MKKKTIVRITSMAMAAMLTVSQLGLGDGIRVFAEETAEGEAGDSSAVTAETVTLQDGNFSGNFWDDKIWSTSEWNSSKVTLDVVTYTSKDVMVDEHCDGDSAFTFWREKAGSFGLTQLVDVLPAGEYTLTSYVMGENADIELTMYDSDNNKIEPETSNKVSLEKWNVWQEVSETFVIDEAVEDVTVGVQGTVADGGYGYIDHLTISGVSKSTEDSAGNTGDGESTSPIYTILDQADYTVEDVNFITNGDFETGDKTGWTVTDNGVSYEVKIDGYASNNKSNIFHIDNKTGKNTNFEVDYNADISLEAGTYLLSVDTDGVEDTANGLSVSIGSKGADATSTATKVLDKTTGWDSWNTTSLAFKLDKDDVAALKISGTVPAGYWGDIDNVKLVKITGVNDNTDDGNKGDSEDDDSTAVDAEVFVTRNTEVDDDFITGADVSSYYSLIKSGACFYDKDGSKLDEQGFFDLLKAGGTNYIRLRVWNNPYDAEGNGYGGGNNDLEAAKVMGQYATKAGMKVLIDFHFSDFWADPAKQQSPKAWSDMSHEERINAITEFTTTSLTELLDAGVDVGMVQIGNETNNGFCGETYKDDGWDKVSQLFDAGCQAVKSVAEEKSVTIKRVLHFANPEKSGSYAKYAENLAANNVDYDVFASSYYPYWHGSTDNLTNVLKNIADNYGKEVMVAETSWATTLDDGDGHDNTVRVGNNDVDMSYDFSLQGQADEITAVANAVTAVGNAGIGMFYWEPAWIPVENAYDSDGNQNESIVESNKTKWEQYGSGWASSYSKEYDPEDAGKWYGGSAIDNQAWFDFNGKALDTVSIYNYIRSGATTDVRPLRATADSVTIEYSQLDSLKLPASVTIKYNDGTVESVDSVKWNDSQVSAAKEKGVGTYVISGVCTAASGAEINATFRLCIEYDNELLNGKFDGTDTFANWVLSDNVIFNTTDISVNSRNNSAGCAHFYTDKAGASATATQTVKLKAGKYALTGYIQGGGNGTSDVFSIKAIVGDETYTAAGELSGWKVWSNPTIDEIVITEDDTEIQVVLSIENTTAGVWGSFDDIALYRIGDIDSKDNTDTKEDADKGDSGNTDTKEDTDKGDSGNTDTKEDTDKGDSGNTDTKDDVDKENSGSTDSKDDGTPDSNNNGVSEDKNESYITEEVDKSFASFGDTVDFANGDDRTVINNGISIKGSTSALPAGVKFEVSSLAKTSKSYASAEKALSEKKLDGKFTVQEINLKDAEGTQLHKMGDYVVVTLPVPEGFTVSSTTTIAVYRLEDDGTLTKCTSTVVDGKLSFSTNHFSTYVFVEEPVAAQVEPEQKADPAEVDTPSTAPTASAAPVQTALASVKTGDDTGMGWMIMLLIAGLSAAVASAYGMKKTNK